MDQDEFQKWLFPPVLTWKRKLVINAIMFCVLILVVYLFGAPK